MNRTITREVKIVPSVSELATCFCDLGHDDQAYFLRLVALEFQSWPSLDRDSQLLSIAKELREDDEQRAEPARAMIRLLAEEVSR